MVAALLACLALAQEREPVTLDFVVTAPPSTPADSSLFLAGNVAELCGWKPDGVKLARGDDGLFRARVAVARGARLEFKVTRGSWALVEKGEGGVEIPNRVHVATSDALIQINVAAWADAKPRSTVTGTVERHEGFGPRSGLLPRALLVWLPPGYADHPELRCPVLYMHDGQNLFDAATAFGGSEWRVDETCDRLVRAGAIPPLIVVGIENTRDRVAEYTPTPDEKLPRGGRAAAHATMLLDEVKPFVDARYRTLPERDHTFVGGSSLGGLVSLWLVHEHADRFAGAAALSPALQWDHEWMRREWERAPLELPKLPIRLWLDMGTREGEPWIESLRAFATTLDHTGLTRDRDFIAREYEDAGHHETAWAARFEEVVRFLIGSAPEPAPKPAPNPLPKKEE